MCLYGKLLKNPKYKSNKKNGGQVPPILDERTIYVPVGCGNCIECRKQKAREWQVRLSEDIRTNNNAKFITLTFSNESIKKLCETKTDGNVPITELYQGYELDNWIATRAMRLFNERWRKKHKKALRHWMITELGHKGTQNIHLHGIIWTDNIQAVESIWQYGYIWKGHMKNGKIINYVNETTTGYITKYINKMDFVHKTYKQIVLTSPGIGGNYTNRYDAIKNKYKKEETNETYRTRTGHKIKLPIYYRNKIYNDEEREKLWIDKLNKEERWICGERIDVSQNYETYWKVLNYHRERNKKLGYGTNENNWKRQKYEEEVRKIMQATRIKQTQHLSKGGQETPHDKCKPAT